MSTAQLMMNWTDDGTSIRMDVLSLVVALAIHLPLYFVKFDAHRKTFDRPAERLVSVDLIEPDAPKVVAPPPVAKKDTGFFSKLKELVQREPPPPPVPVKKIEPKQLDLKPKEIKLDPKRDLPEAMAPKLQSKSGFETKADPKLIEKKQIELKNLGAGVAPLSAKRVGVIENRQDLKRDKGNFQVAKAESLSSIGGSGPGIATPGAPAISIRTGSSASKEKFSAAAPQIKADKGSFKAGDASLGGSSNLSLREQIIARDAAPTQIGSTGGVRGGVPGGVPGGALATKKDAGTFDSSRVASVGSASGTGRASASAPAVAPIVTPSKVKKKKEMFVITGPLKDRPVERQVVPEYPAWAQSRGIESAVVLEFTVTPDGRVKNNVVVRRTSGYPRLDQSAIDALRQWQFKPLVGDENREEVGLITFNYTLN